LEDLRLGEDISLCVRWAAVTFVSGLYPDPSTVSRRFVQHIDNGSQRTLDINRRSAEDLSHLR
jgi:hypothetical protein